MFCEDGMLQCAIAMAHYRLMCFLKIGCIGMLTMAHYRLMCFLKIGCIGMLTMAHYLPL